MKKRIISIILSIVMLVSLLPTTALAADSEATWTTTTTAGGEPDYSDASVGSLQDAFGAANTAEGTLYVKLNKNVTSADGVTLAANKSMVLNLSSYKITVTISSSSASNNSGIYTNSGSSLTLQNGTVSVSAASNVTDVYAIRAYGSLTAKDCTINATHSNGNVYGVRAYSAMSITDCVVSANGKYDTVGIRTNGGSVTGGSVRAESGAYGTGAYGIYTAGELKVSGCEITATTTAKNTSCGIYSAENAGKIIMDSGSATATGYGEYTYGLYMYGRGSVVLSGGNFSGSKYAVKHYFNTAASLLAEGYGYFINDELQNLTDETSVGGSSKTVTVKEIPKPHSHPICGATHTNIGDHTGTCEAVEWTALSSLLGEPDEDGMYPGTTINTNGNYYLDKDITIKYNQALTISSDVSLCLNGHTLYHEGNLEMFIEVADGGKFTVCDCSDDESGMIYNFDYQEVTVWVTNGTLNLYSGTLRSDRYNGVRLECEADSTFNQYGGIVQADSTYDAVSIEGEDAVSAAYNLYGGTVKTTSANSGSVISISGANTTLSMSGAPEISNASSWEYASDIYTETPIHIMNELTANAPKYSVMYSRWDDNLDDYIDTGIFTDGWPTYMVNEDHDDYFVSADSDFAVLKDISGELKIAETVTVSFNANEGSGTMDDVLVEKDGTYTLPSCTFTPPTGKQFAGWALTANGEVISEATITVSANTTLYAVWADAPAETHSHDMSVDCGGSGVTFEPWDGTTTFPGGNVYLTDNVTLTETLTISSGTVNMCLNGHSITNSSAAIEVKSGATLNICDCKSNGTVSATASGSRGINNSGTVKVYGGTVSGKTYGISNDFGNVTVYDGTVSGGTGILNYGTLTVSGGSVTGTHDYGGYGISSYGTLKLSGAPTITGGSNSADVLIHAYQKVITIDGALTYSTPISVEPYDGYSAFTKGWNDKMPTADHNDYFIPASGKYVFVESSDELKPAYTVTYDANGAASGSVPVDSSSPYFYSKVVTVLGNTGGLAKEGYEFSGWNTKADGTGTHYAPDSTFTIYSNTTLYAVWKVPHIHEYTYAVNTENAAQIIESCSCGHEETATVSGPTGTIVYDGTEKKGATVSYSTGWLGDTLTVTYVNNIYAGQATASITKAGATASVNFIINKAEPDYTLPKEVTATYGDTLEDIKISDWGSGWSWKEPTTSVGDVGTKTFVAVFTPADTNNYNAVEDEVSVTVKAKQLTNPTIELSQDSFTYDGTEKKPAVTVKDGTTSLTNGVDYDITWPTDCKSAGTKDVTVTFKGNYSGTKTAKYVIVKADSSCIAPVAVADLVYTGSAQTLVTAATPTGGTVQYSLSETGTFSDSIPTGTDAGTYTVYYKVIGDANHNGTDVLDPVQVTISKAKAEITVDQTAIVKTFGETLTLPEATSNFGEVVCDKTAEDLVNVGSYTVTYTVVGTDNYDGDTKTVSVTINKLAVNEPSVSGTYTYTGEEQTATVTGKADYMTETGDVKGTDAGDYTITYTLDGNHCWADGSDGTVTWSIAKRTVTLIAGSDEKVFDGTPLTCTTFTVKEDTTTAGYGFVVDEGIQSVTMTDASTITDVGSADNVIDTITFKEGTLESNYNITKEKGTVTVKAPQPHNVTAQVQGSHGTATVVDGEAQTVTEAVKDTALTFTATPKSDYSFDYWEVVSGGITLSDDDKVKSELSVTMPDTALTLKAHFKEVVPTAFNVIVENDGHGTAVAQVDSSTVTEAAPNATVTLVPTASDGYAFKEWQIARGLNEGDITDNAFTMPANEVKIKAIFEKVYTVTVEAKGHGTASANVQKGVTGKEVELTITPDNGYELDQITVVRGGVTVTDKKFAIGTADVKIRVTFKAIIPDKYNIIVEDDGHGTASAEPTSAAPGETVTLTANPKEGYAFKEWQIARGLEKTDISAENSFTMPASEVKVKAIFEKVYTVTVEANGHGSASADVTSGVSGKDVTLTLTPDNGYEVDQITVVRGGVEVSNNKFQIGTADVKIQVTFKETPPDAYNIIVEDDGHGTASANPTSAAQGTNVTLTATPNDGYAFKEWKIERGLEAGAITNNSFTMPASEVKVKAIFEKVYNINVQDDGHGSGHASHETAAVGTEIELSAESNEGYEFDEWKIVSGSFEITDD